MLPLNCVIKDVPVLLPGSELTNESTDRVSFTWLLVLLSVPALETRYIITPHLSLASVGAHSLGSAADMHHTALLGYHWCVWRGLAPCAATSEMQQDLSRVQRFNCDLPD